MKMTDEDVEDFIAGLGLEMGRFPGADPVCISVRRNNEPPESIRLRISEEDILREALMGKSREDAQLVFEAVRQSLKHPSFRNAPPQMIAQLLGLSQP